MLGVLSSTRHPLKILVFGRCREMLQESLKPIRESFAPYKGGPSAKVLLMVRGMGRAALYLKVSPAGLGLRPDHVRWPDLHADATQPATGHLALRVLVFPFP